MYENPNDYDKTPNVTVDINLGYAMFLDRNHPLSSKGVGRVWYHRHIASVKVGRWLSRAEVVHHIDGNKLNNDPDNLQVMSNSEHAKLHFLLDNPDYKPPEFVCESCGEVVQKRTKKMKFCSQKCSQLDRRLASRPTKLELKALMESHSFCALGRMYGVSDNAIRKWARRYGLL